ncbi:MAG: CRISPR-associated protein Cas4 [Phycisphaerae bacterium]
MAIAMYEESQLLPISALQHLLFCERQCALIHIERVWVENRLTIEGRHLHEKTHGERRGPRGGGLNERRENVRTTRGMQLRSFQYGLYGVADVVEFHLPDGNSAQSAPTPLPVEYKRGRPKRGDHDRVQLCAQALCIEEMLGVAVPEAALFYGAIKKRETVPMDHKIRARTIDAAQRLHELIVAGKTPIARREPKCKNCSLVNLCLPDAVGPKRSAVAWLTRAIKKINDEFETANDE